MAQTNRLQIPPLTFDAPKSKSGQAGEIVIRGGRTEVHIHLHIPRGHVVKKAGAVMYIGPERKRPIRARQPRS